MEQADGENLVRPHRSISAVAIHHVIETAGRFIPELRAESYFAPGPPVAYSERYRRLSKRWARSSIMRRALYQSA